MFSTAPTPGRFDRQNTDPSDGQRSNKASEVHFLAFAVLLCVQPFRIYSGHTSQEATMQYTTVFLQVLLGVVLMPPKVEGCVFACSVEVPTPDFVDNPPGLGMWPDNRCADLEAFEQSVNCLAAQECCVEAGMKRTRDARCPHNKVTDCKTKDVNETLHDVYGDLCEIESFHRCTSDIPLDCKHGDQIRECAAVHQCCSRLDHPPYNTARSRLPSIPSLGDCMGVPSDRLQTKCFDAAVRRTKWSTATECDHPAWEMCQNKYHQYLGKLNATERADCGVIMPGRKKFKGCAERSMCANEFNQYRENWSTLGGYCTDLVTFPPANTRPRWPTSPPDEGDDTGL